MDLPCEPIFSAEIQHAGFSVCAVQHLPIDPLSEYPVRLMGKKQVKRTGFTRSRFRIQPSGSASLSALQ